VKLRHKSVSMISHLPPLCARKSHRSSGNIAQMRIYFLKKSFKNGIGAHVDAAIHHLRLSLKPNVS
jgi:hypothetical protein